MITINKKEIAPLVEKDNPKNPGKAKGKGERALAEVMELAKQFEKDYPGLADAIRLFQVTNDQYQLTLQNLYEPRIYSCHSTSGVDNGYLERDKRRD